MWRPIWARYEWRWWIVGVVGLGVSAIGNLNVHRNSWWIAVAWLGALLVGLAIGRLPYLERKARRLDKQERDEEIVQWWEEWSRLGK